MHAAIAFGLAALTGVLAAPASELVQETRRDTTNCFPYGTATVPKDLSKPNVALKDWWCPQSMAYGFQGFSYPLEEDCGAQSNTYSAMNKDFAQMKKDFGASIVRMYYPICTNETVFENAIKAAVTNDMAVIFQVWTNFGDGTVWKQSQQAIYNAMASKTYGAVAPYVVHSADFGSEPVGDCMDGCSTQFIADLGAFRAKMNSYGVPVGISEDWDRRGTMASSDGSGLGPIGQGVKANSDYAHVHIMPYYSGNPTVDSAWSYITAHMQWTVNVIKMPSMITESQWGWGTNANHGGDTHLSVAEYTKYWKNFDNNCELFKSYNMGWFLHTWRGESTFDIMYPNGSYVIPNWKPRKC